MYDNLAACRRNCEWERVPGLIWSVLVIVGMLAMPVIAQGPSGTAGRPETATESVRVSGPQLIRDAAIRVLNCRSISAQLRHRMDLYGRDLVGSGMYHQARLDRDLLFRTELQVPIAGGLMSLMQVCDGRYVWTRTTRPSGDGTTAATPLETCVDAGSVEKLLDPKHAADFPQGNGIQSNGIQSNGMEAMAPLGLGGLLFQLSNRFRFGEPTASEVAGVKVWLLHGIWDERSAVAPDAVSSAAAASQTPRDKPAAAAPMPPSMPHSVTLAVGADDLFPYIIEYRQKVKFESEKDGSSGIVLRSNERIIMAIEFFEVEFNAPYNPQVYVFRPTSVATP